VEQDNGSTNENYKAIFDIVHESAIVNYDWNERGIAPLGYYKGMALVFARIYSRLKLGDEVAQEMAKANTGNAQKDVMAFYAEKMADAGLLNEADGADTLRHLFVLMVGLGMMESSGKYCTGRDANANNVDAETAEAGLFQTSYNARNASNLLNKIFEHYKSNPDGFLEVFSEGVKCSPDDWENHGNGDGKEFQELSKKCPAFAAEFAGVALRNARTHWGTINDNKVEIKPECDVMFHQVQDYIDVNTITSISAKVAEPALENLVDGFRQKVVELIENCKNRGIIMRPYFTLRDPFTQAKLWRQSRTSQKIKEKIDELKNQNAPFLAHCLESVGKQHGPHVTNAIPGLSWHQWGEAVDCEWVVNGETVWSTEETVDGLNGYMVYAAEAKKLELEAGFFWTTFQDSGHVQFRKAANPLGDLTIVQIDKEMENRFG
jgi:hypothetical protein